MFTMQNKNNGQVQSFEVESIEAAKHLADQKGFSVFYIFKHFTQGVPAIRANYEKLNNEWRKY